jgi:hypothetical protein
MPAGGPLASIELKMSIRILRLYAAPLASPEAQVIVTRLDVVLEDEL